MVVIVLARVVISAIDWTSSAPPSFWASTSASAFAVLIEAVEIRLHRSLILLIESFQNGTPLLHGNATILKVLQHFQRLNQLLLVVKNTLRKDTTQAAEQIRLLL